MTVPRATFALVAVAAALATPPAAPARPAALPLNTVEHAVRVTTLQRSGRPLETARQESWIGDDRSRLVATDARGTLLGETLYTPEMTFIFRPGFGLLRSPATRRGAVPGVEPLDGRTSTRCALEHPETYRLRSTERLGRAADVFRFRHRFHGGSRETTTCVVDALSRALLESRTVLRITRGGAVRTTVSTMRVVLHEFVTPRPGMLELSPHAAASGPGRPLPAPDR